VDKEINEIVVEQLGEQEVGDAKSEASISSFTHAKSLMMSSTQITIHLGIIRWF